MTIPIKNIRKAFTPEAFARFNGFIRGQTVELGKDGEMVYAYDLGRFLNGEGCVD